MTICPQVTVGIPFYNCGEYLVDAIQSVFAQTFTNWELILIDDGSSDNSLAIACSVLDPRVRVISDGLNRGLAARLNQIAELARCPFVARMDADDLMDPTRLERQMAVFATRPDIDLVGTGTFSMTSNDLLVGARGADKGPPSLKDALRGKTGIVHASLIYRREWIRRHRYDESCGRSEDYELWARAASVGDLRSLTISSPLYIYREDLNIVPEKLLAAYAIEAACVRNFAPRPYIRGAALLRIGAKKAIVRYAFTPGLKRRLQRKRNDVMPNEQMRLEFSAVLRRIRDVRVPGLNCAPCVR